MVEFSNMHALLSLGGTVFSANLAFAEELRPGLSVHGTRKTRRQAQDGGLLPAIGADLLWAPLGGAAAQQFMTGMAVHWTRKSLSALMVSNILAWPRLPHSSGVLCL
jgi:hypothetical protein